MACLLGYPQCQLLTWQVGFCAPSEPHSTRHCNGGHVANMPVARCGADLLWENTAKSLLPQLSGVSVAHKWQRHVSHRKLCRGALQTGAQ